MFDALVACGVLAVLLSLYVTQFVVHHTASQMTRYNSMFTRFVQLPVVCLYEFGVLCADAHDAGKKNKTGRMVRGRLGEGLAGASISPKR